MKLFDKWDTENIQIKEKALEPYIKLPNVLVPKSCGRYAYNRFWISKTHIVERLMCKLQVAGHKGKKHRLSSGSCTGKGLTHYNIVKKTLEIIEQKTKTNPIQVLVTAIENAAPREAVTTIEYGGARYPKALELAPLKRIDLVLRLFCQGSYQKTFGKKKKIEQALADEILLAYKIDQASVAISKKLELERQADSSR